MNPLLHTHTALPDGMKSGATSVVHLLPAGEFKGTDGRGPYRVADAAAIITASMAGGKLVLDENHATDHAMQKGGSAPAIGWITEMHARQDGIWGTVAWTKAGKALIEDHAYRGISPAFSAPGGAVDRIHRASLTNAPNLSLTHLHNQEPRMDLAELRRRLGLPENAAQADIERALDTARGAVSLHSQVATAIGLQPSASASDLVTGITAKLTAAGGDTQRVVELQSQIDKLNKDGKERDATAYIDGEIRAGRVIPEESRKHLIELHQTQPDMVKGIVNGLPQLRTGGAGSAVRGRVQLPSGGGGVEAHASAVAAALELKDPAAFAMSLKGAR